MIEGHDWRELPEGVKGGRSRNARYSQASRVGTVTITQSLTQLFICQSFCYQSCKVALPQKGYAPAHSGDHATNAIGYLPGGVHRLIAQLGKEETNAKVVRTLCSHGGKLDEVLNLYLRIPLRSMMLPRTRQAVRIVFCVEVKQVSTRQCCR